MRKYLFSVVIPIYNCAKYLDETIISVINQTIGFKNIELILVNDGSTDNSEEICLKYKEKYDNVIYIRQKNSGVSTARNKGLEVATGKYINFLDSDDKWEKDVFKKAYNLFLSDKDLLVIGVRQKFFEASKSYASSMNYKFENNKDGIYDITKHFDYVQLSVTSAFIKTDVSKSIKFDKRIKYSEDAKYLCELFIKFKNTKLGLISSSLHLYRKRKEGNSAIQSKDFKPDWYIQTVELSYKYILEKCKKEFPILKNYVLYYIMYDYQFRLGTNLDRVQNLTLEEKEQYIKNSLELINEMNDNIILMQHNLKWINKEICLIKKGYTEKEALDRIINFLDNENYLLEINISSLKIKENKLLINGFIPLIYNKNIKAYYNLNGKETELKLTKRLFFSNKTIINDSENDLEFNCEIPLNKNDNLSFYIKYKNKNIKLTPEFSYWARMGNFKNAYRQIGKYNICLDNGNIIISRKGKFISEIKLQIYLLKTNKLKSLIYRNACLLAKMFKGKKEIWILCDRKDKAGDNAEAFLKYLNKVNNKNIKFYYAINKGSVDEKRISAFAKVLNFDTFKYKVMFTLCDKIISSHADKFVYSCFGKSNDYMSNLLNFKFIFLQHGITGNDMSDWLNKHNLPFDMFITTLNIEYQSIINDPKYGYDKNVVKLTGFPRYDYLTNKDKKYHSILIAPTWRAYLAPQIKPGEQERLYNPNFINSNYYKFYNKLFNDIEFINILKKYNYKIKFFLHYSLKNQLKDFKLNEYVEIIENPNYQYEFNHNDLLVTDYSSISYDFAYLKKPLIYNHFDKEEFYKGHICNKGYFNHEKDGFGKVVYDYDSLKNEIINLIKNDCKNPQKYIKRIENTFKYTDHNNCERVYKEILKLK